ncbi:MAG: insulinase family protein [Oscillospiraceae bacterium]|nr:insulinase family protein [Oscillospiraceae bacterium]
MKEITEQLCDGVKLIRMTEPKFKTSHIKIIMSMPAQPEKYAGWNLAHNILLNSCEKYPSIAKMSEKMQALYGANLDSNVSVLGDVFQLHFTVSAIADAYALHQESLRRESAELLLECIQHPLQNPEKTGFSERAFQMELQNLLDAIDGEINNKRAYAFKKLREIAFSGEVAAYSYYGTKEDALALTPESVYQAYKEILEQSEILIYYVGAEDAPELSDLFRGAFSPRTVTERCYTVPSPCKPEVRTVRESMEVNQSQLLMAFKMKDTGTEQNRTPEQLRMTSLIFGGAPFSLLFSNIREKMSLCYYCSSKDISLKNTLVVSSGVSPENLEKTKQAILEQLELLKNGELEPDLLENARRYIINALQLAGDTPSSCMMESLERYIREDHAGIPERIALFEQVTREDIIRTANALELDSVYILEQEGKHA